MAKQGQSSTALRAAGADAGWLFSATRRGGGEVLEPRLGAGYRGPPCAPWRRPALSQFGHHPPQAGDSGYGSARGFGRRVGATTGSKPRTARRLARGPAARCPAAACPGPRFGGHGHSAPGYRGSRHGCCAKHAATSHAGASRCPGAGRHSCPAGDRPRRRHPCPARAGPRRPTAAPCFARCASPAVTGWSISAAPIH